MRDRDVYRPILGLAEPWEVTEVELSEASKEVRVHVRPSGRTLECPECGKECSGVN